jgi:hypothetical protein
MPSSAVRTFTDPDDYTTAIRQETSELTVTERGHFTAKLTRIDLHRLWMQRFCDNLPRISHITGWGGRAVIAFRTETGPSLLSNGIEMEPTNLVRYSEGQNYYRRSSGFAAYAGMSLPLAEMAAFGEALVAVDLTPPRDAMLITPLPAAMARLQRLHAAAGYLAETAPEILENQEAARGLEQTLVEAMVACLADQKARDNRVWRKGSTRSLCAASAGSWRRPQSNRSIFRRYARRSGSRTAHCANAARSIWGWDRSATCFCAACTWRDGRCARPSRTRLR